MSDRDDLLRVDGTGTVHPVGRAASQSLRPRAGEWRIIPTPKDLIIARSMSGGDAVLKLAGEIRTPGALSDIVALAAQSQWTGELILLAEIGTRSFYFDHGTVIHASTTVAEERLGETLYRFGVITREQLERVVAENEKWDGRTKGLVVTNTTERTIEVRALVSARNSGDLWDLRVDVRERLVAWLRDYEGGKYLPRVRVGDEEGRAERAAASD